MLLVLLAGLSLPLSMVSLLTWVYRAVSASRVQLLFNQLADSLINLNKR
jgi:hypothetical protein